jgi:hypothetical protein
MDEEELRGREESERISHQNELHEASNSASQSLVEALPPRHFPAEMSLPGHTPGHPGNMHAPDPNWSSVPLGQLTVLAQQHLLRPTYMYQGYPPHSGLAGLAQPNPYGHNLLYQSPPSMYPFSAALPSHHAAGMPVGNLLQAAESQQLLGCLQQLHGDTSTSSGAPSSLQLESQHGQVDSTTQGSSTSTPLQSTLTQQQLIDSIGSYTSGRNLQSASGPTPRSATTLPATTDEAEQSSTKKKRRYNHEGFPQKLHRLILEAHAENNEHIVKFTEDGKQFQIVDTVSFEGILPRYFRHGKISSFKRLLHMYGFQRTQGTWNEGTFAHALFRRDRPELCKEMSRIERVNRAM